MPNPAGHRFAAFTDWLNCTFVWKSEYSLPWFFGLVEAHLGAAFSPAVNQGKGLHGWLRSFEFGNTKAKFGVGGQRGTAFVSLPGAACALVGNWAQVVHLFRDRLQGKPTRWDGAADDYSGEHSVDLAVEQYQQGEFNCGGSKPSCGQAGNWIEPDGSGRTLYVGKRKSGKMLRVYEKGKQLGDPSSPWVRWELELHNVDREIPWDVLLEPGRFVAGAYPCLSWVSERISRIETIKRSIAIGYDDLVNSGKLAYGKLINVMLEREGSAEKVIEKLIRAGIPARLDYHVAPSSEDQDD